MCVFVHVCMYVCTDRQTDRQADMQEARGRVYLDISLSVCLSVHTYNEKASISTSVDRMWGWAALLWHKGGPPMRYTGAVVYSISTESCPPMA